jgi:hypothetical protein
MIVVRGAVVVAENIVVRQVEIYAIPNVHGAGVVGEGADARSVDRHPVLTITRAVVVNQTVVVREPERDAIPIVERAGVVDYVAVDGSPRDATPAVRGTVVVSQSDIARGSEPNTIPFACAVVVEEAVVVRVVYADPSPSAVCAYAISDRAILARVDADVCCERPLTRMNITVTDHKMGVRICDAD